MQAAARAILENWLREGTARQRLFAAIVIERQRGAVIQAIAWRLGVHKDTVRRWLARYQRDGVAALSDRKRKRWVQRVFDDPTRAAIQLVAAQAPGQLGVSLARWSLPTLRAHLVRTQVVRTISVERLRQILSEMNGRPRSWREPAPAPIALSDGEWRRLQGVRDTPALGLRAAIVLAAAADHPVKAIAIDLHISENTVRRWLARYRAGGIRALVTARVYRQPTVFTPAVRQRIVAMAAQPPRMSGIAGDRWSLDKLRRHLVRHRVVASISREWLRHILHARDRCAAA